MSSIPVQEPGLTGASLLSDMRMSWESVGEWKPAGGYLWLLKPGEIVDVWSVLSMQALLGASIDTDPNTRNGFYRVGNTMTDLALEPTVSPLIKQLASEALSGARLWLCLDWQAKETKYGLVSVSNYPNIFVYFSRKANAFPGPSPLAASGPVLRYVAEIAYPGSDPVLWVNKGRLLELLDTVDFVGGRPVGLGGKGASSAVSASAVSPTDARPPLQMPAKTSSGSGIFYGVAAAAVLGGLYWYSKRRGRLVPNALVRPEFPSSEDEENDSELKLLAWRAEEVGRKFAEERRKAGKYFSDEKLIIALRRRLDDNLMLRTHTAGGYEISPRLILKLAFYGARSVWEKQREKERWLAGREKIHDRRSDPMARRWRTGYKERVPPYYYFPI